MYLQFLIIASYVLLEKTCIAEDFSVTRHADGDIFVIKGPCSSTCLMFSSGTASPYFENTTNSIEDVPCKCKCNADSPIFREDLQICVNDIDECNTAEFTNDSGVVEKVPYIYLPEKNGIIYPHAKIKFKGVKTAVCGIGNVQQLGRGGWFELRNLSNSEPPFKLFQDKGITFYLQWAGETELRSTTEGRIIVANLVCHDAYSVSFHSGVFAPCVAFRIAGSTSKNGIREVTFLSNSRISEGLSATEYTAIGLSSIMLALIYVASVSLYLQSKRNKQNTVVEDPEIVFPDEPHGGADVVKNNLLLASMRHFGNDSGGQTESENEDDLPQSDSDQEIENTTSAIVHRNTNNSTESADSFSSTGSIIGEKLPEENVRIIETAENNNNSQETPVLPGNQRRKLYFNPAYFDRQLLLAPPPAAVEFLLKIREVITIAKHKMSAKRFVPTLFGIPEEDNASERSSKKHKHIYQNSPMEEFNSPLANQSKRLKNCSGCPGCSEPPIQVPSLPETARDFLGENRVRAWLEDIKPIDQRWKELQGIREKNMKNFSQTLEYPKKLRKYDLADSNFNKLTSIKSTSNWKDTCSKLQILQHSNRSDILDNDCKHNACNRSTKSVPEECMTNYERCADIRRNHLSNLFPFEEIAANIKIRKAIENSFIKEMEEVAMRNLDNDLNKHKNEEQTKNAINLNSNSVNNPVPDVPKKKKEISKCVKNLPDMISELSPTEKPKHIMDAVIREMVISKCIDSEHSKAFEYEVDSLERTKTERKLSNSSVQSNNESNSTVSTALPMEEELTARNAVINSKTGEMLISNQPTNVMSNSLPELIIQKPENYSLVSEVYVNDGYTSPTGSDDDSGPEIQYEPENPGYLMIKVHDSPNNYVKQDESDYEPDTLDRKPMKLKINGDVHYDKTISSESYVDSLERPGLILLKSKSSFKNETNNGNSKVKRGLGSLREIYEARMKKQLRNQNGTCIKIGNHETSDSDNSSWNEIKYLTPDSRQARRQMKPQNRPDVLPPPSSEELYQQPKSPMRMEQNFDLTAKNARDRRCAKAGHPTTADGAPVLKKTYPFTTVGLKTWTKDETICSKQPKSSSEYMKKRHCSDKLLHSFNSNFYCLPKRDFRQNHNKIRTIHDAKHNLLKSNLLRVEDSGYLSSADSNESQKHLLKSYVTEEGSYSETDEAESICDGVSESGAESIDTDSVFFGNFRKLSEASKFSKSTDSGVDVDLQQNVFTNSNLRHDIFNDSNLFNASDSETESFVTVLTPSTEKSLVL